ncbi:MAG TPA: DMT family transporter [Stellaceae bacterium]|nr:DMT family transporter [Stellaceae bacterium]
MVLLFIVPGLLASNMIAARWVNGAIPPVALAFWRWTGTLALLLVLVGGQLWAQRAALAREWPVLLLLGSLGMGLCGAPVYLAARMTTATNIGLIYAASPVMVAVLAALWWGERLSLIQAVGVAFSFVGVVAIITRGDLASLIRLDFNAGDALTVVASASWAVYSVVLRRHRSDLGNDARFAAIAAGGVLATAPFYGLELAFGDRMSIDWSTLGVIAFLALVPGYLGYALHSRLIDRLGASRASVMLYLIPLYNAGLATVLLGERLALFHLVGLILILGGVALANRVPRKQDQTG